jgi:hypothetical protein
MWSPDDDEKLVMLPLGCTTVWWWRLTRFWWEFPLAWLALAATVPATSSATDVRIVNVPLCIAISFELASRDLLAWSELSPETPP